MSNNDKVSIRVKSSLIRTMRRLGYAIPFTYNDILEEFMVDTLRHVSVEDLNARSALLTPLKASKKDEEE